MRLLIIFLLLASSALAVHNPSIPDSVWMLADGWQRRQSTAGWLASSGARLGTLQSAQSISNASDTLCAYSTGTGGEVADSVWRCKTHSDSFSGHSSNTGYLFTDDFDLDSAMLIMKVTGGISDGVRPARVFAVLSGLPTVWVPNEAIASAEYNDWFTGDRGPSAFDSASYSTTYSDTAWLTFRALGTYLDVIDSLAHVTGALYSINADILTYHDYYNDSSATASTVHQSLKAIYSETAGTVDDPRWLFFWTDNTVPGTPTLSTPADLSSEGACPPGSTEFSWSAAADASHYEVQISTEDAFATPFFDDSVGTGTSATINITEDANLFYWRVRAMNYGVAGSYSDAFSFCCGPDATTLTLPTDGSTLAVVDPITFGWSNVVGADTHTLEISTTTSFDSPVFDTTLGDVTAFNFDNLNGSWYLVLNTATTYYWRVQTSDVCDGTTWSDTSSFHFPTATVLVESQFCGAGAAVSTGKKNQWDGQWNSGAFKRGWKKGSWK